MITMSGRELADSIKDQLKIKLDSFDIKPKLTVIQIGENVASSKYIAMKRKACDLLGIDFDHLQLEADIADEQVTRMIAELNLDDSITGIIVQLPLPESFQTDYILESISPYKDVDGLTAENIGRLAKGSDGLFPATAEGVINLLRYYKIPMTGVNAVVLGRSNLVGKPIAQMLLTEGATVTICHSKTPDISIYTSKADIIISAVGKTNLLTAEMVKDGAVVVDVGIDVDFEGVSTVAGYITPAIGGVGPMTVAMLLSNVVKAAKMQKEE